jgi:hypothetical protein
MSLKPLFNGLIFDEEDQLVEVTYVGEEPCYVINDAGFRRHIPTRDVDRQIVKYMMQQVKGNEDALSEQTARLMGQDDIFTRAMIQNQYKNFDKQIDQLFLTGIPEGGRAYMGMMGFRVVVDLHGEVKKIEQPGMVSGDEEGE